MLVIRASSFVSLTPDCPTLDPWTLDLGPSTLDFDPNNVGLLLIGHGTRDPAGLAEFHNLVAAVQAATPQRVEAGFLELAQPTIGKAFDRLAQRGAKRIRVVPLLLFAAGHARSDVPHAVQQAAARHPLVSVEISEPFGCDEHLLALSKRRYDEALVDWPAISPQECYLLLVGRGSSDASATAEMEKFARQRAERSALEKFGVAFVAVARPALDEALSQAAAAGVRRVVVQPHLLFRGAVLGEVHAAVARWRAQKPDLDWIVTAHLGAEQELVRAVLREMTNDEARMTKPE